MNTIKSSRIRYVLTSLLTIAVGYGSTAIAAPPGAPDFDNTWAAGVACPFELRIEGWDGVSQAIGGNRSIKVFTNGGVVVRTLSAGTGATLRYTNTATGKSIWTKSNGATVDTRYNLDGSFTQTGTGHNVLILYPTDTPPGPSTTLYVGRVVADYTAT